MLLLGMKITEKEKEQHIENLRALTAFMKTEYPGLTTGDLVLAYRLGVKYKLGIEMYAELNPRQLGKVMDAYEQFKREELTRDPVPAPSPAALLPEAIPTEEQLDRANAQLFRFAYQCVQQGRTYRDMGSLIYNWLDAKGLIPFDKGRKWDFMKQAQVSIQREQAGHGATGNMQEHKDARSLAALLKQATEENKLLTTQKEAITTRAKQLAFNTLLTELVEMETTADEFLNNTPEEDAKTD